MFDRSQFHLSAMLDRHFEPLRYFLGVRDRGHRIVIVTLEKVRTKANGDILRGHLVDTGIFTDVNKHVQKIDADTLERLLELQNNVPRLAFAITNTDAALERWWQQVSGEFTQPSLDKVGNNMDIVIENDTIAGITTRLTADEAAFVDVVLCLGTLVAIRSKTKNAFSVAAAFGN